MMILMFKMGPRKEVEDTGLEEGRNSFRQRGLLLKSFERGHDWRNRTEFCLACCFKKSNTSTMGV